MKVTGARASVGGVPARHVHRPDRTTDRAARPDRAARSDRSDRSDRPERRPPGDRRPAGDRRPGGSTRPPGAYPAAAPYVSGPVPAPPTTMSLVISRRARREAAAAAEAAAHPPDPRLAVIEHVLTGLHVAGNVLVLGLSAVGWLWLGVHRPAVSGAAGQVTSEAARNLPVHGLAANPLLQPLATATGATLVLIMLATCLLMAPVVNPFYAPPEERRLLHTATTLLFGVLAVTTVAVIAGAAR